MKQALVQKSSSNAPTPQQLEEIHRFCRRSLAPEEVYIFSLVLCDNEIDRDGERFTIPALHRLAELFVGKTGIFDHNPKGENQTARIFATAVEANPERTTRCGEPYTTLTASAYMVRCAKNADLILEIDAGIKKEVSVGCSVESLRCSVCGQDLRAGSCKHIRGRKYRAGGGEVLCCALLENPTDAFEFSFVAVPAQPAAGVTKGWDSSGTPQPQEVCKLLQEGGALRLSSGQAAALGKHIAELEQEAAYGRSCLEELRREVTRLALLATPGLTPALVGKATATLNLEELRTMKAAYAAPVQPQIPLPQLAATPEAGPGPNRVFQI